MVWEYICKTFSKIIWMKRGEPKKIAPQLYLWTREGASSKLYYSWSGCKKNWDTNTSFVLTRSAFVHRAPLNISVRKNVEKPLTVPTGRKPTPVRNGVYSLITNLSTLKNTFHKNGKIQTVFNYIPEAPGPTTSWMILRKSAAWGCILDT